MPTATPNSPNAPSTSSTKPTGNDEAVRILRDVHDSIGGTTTPTWRTQARIQEALRALGEDVALVERDEIRDAADIVMPYARTPEEMEALRGEKSEAEKIDEQRAPERERAAREAEQEQQRRAEDAAANAQKAREEADLRDGDPKVEATGNSITDKPRA